jgi:hypothetical protein
MTARYIPAVVCDGCERPYYGDPDGVLGATRLRARGLGWRTEQGHDFCPRCVERRDALAEQASA